MSDPRGLDEKAPERDVQWLSALMARSAPERFWTFMMQWMEICSLERKWSYFVMVKGNIAGGPGGS